MRGCNAKVMPQKITLTLRPVAAFGMPYSEGYQLYSVLLGVMQEARFCYGQADARLAHQLQLPGPTGGPVPPLGEGHAQGRRC